MNASELILKLQNTINEVGDCKVLIYNPYEDTSEEVDSVVYDFGDKSISLESKIFKE